jgi:hypothetical protein
MQALRPPILHGVKREGRGPLFAIRLRQNWPRVGAASPPKREPIVTLQIATYKHGKPASIALHAFHTLSTGMVRRLFYSRIILAGRRLTMEIATLGIDLSKTTFHVIGLNARGEIVLRKKSHVSSF